MSPVASIFRRLAAAVAAVLLAVGGYQAYRYYHRLVPVGDRRIDPRAEIDPRRGYHLVVWEHEVPLPWDAGAHRKALEEAIAEFRRAWPNIEVTLEVLPWQEGHARLREALAKGTPPDVYGMPLGARKVDAQWQVPVGPYLSKEARDDLLPSAVRALSDADGLWAWPRWVQPRVWVAREDLSPELARARPRWSGEEFAAAVAAVKTGSGAYGLALNPFDPSAFVELMVATTGKNLIGDDGTRAWSVEELARGLEFFRELIRRGLVDSDPDRMARSRLAWFWTRRAAVVAPVNPWLLRHLLTRGGVTGSGQGEEEEPGHLALAVPPPSLSTGRGPGRHPAVVSGYAVFRQQEYRGDDHTRAAMALAEHLSRRMGPWEAARLFAVPAHPSAWDGWRAEAGLPRKELDLLVEWARLAVAPPLADAFANVQEKAIETVLAPQFVKLWDGADPEALAREIAAGVDGLRAMVKQPY
ncbi:MAG: hypothetical protein CW345_02225 [Firmicutes bacterium]|nr:hypothetical protein [Bacillota bacterium]